MHLLYYSKKPHVSSVLLPCKLKGMPTRHCSFRQYPNLPFLFPVPSPVSPFPCPKYDNLRFLQWCMFCSLEYCGYIFMLSSSLLRYLLFSCHLPIKACLALLLLCFIELQILHFLTNCDNPESNKSISVTSSAVCAYYDCQISVILLVLQIFIIILLWWCVISDLW